MYTYPAKLEQKSEKRMKEGQTLTTKQKRLTFRLSVVAFHNRQSRKGYC